MRGVSTKGPLTLNIAHLILHKLQSENMSMTPYSISQLIYVSASTIPRMIEICLKVLDKYIPEN